MGYILKTVNKLHIGEPVEIASCITLGKEEVKSRWSLQGVDLETEVGISYLLDAKRIPIYAYLAHFLESQSIKMCWKVSDGICILESYTKYDLQVSNIC